MQQLETYYKFRVAGLFFFRICNTHVLDVTKCVGRDSVNGKCYVDISKPFSNDCQNFWYNLIVEWKSSWRVSNTDIEHTSWRQQDFCKKCWTWQNCERKIADKSSINHIWINSRTSHIILCGNYHEVLPLQMIP